MHLVPTAIHLFSQGSIYLLYIARFHELNCIRNQEYIPSLSDMHISVSEGPRVSPATVDAVEIVNEKHSCPGSDTSSDVIVIGIHCILASSLSVKLSLRPVKSSVAKEWKESFIIIN